MTRIFGSFLVTSCALISCHVVISKQGNGSASAKAGRERVQPEEDHMIRLRHSSKNQESSQRYAAGQRPLGRL